MLVIDRVLFMMTEEKKSELLQLATTFVRQKLKRYSFYGVGICDKNSSIINRKKGINDIYGAIEYGKFFGERITALTFHICDHIYPSQVFFIFFLLRFYM